MEFIFVWESHIEKISEGATRKLKEKMQTLTSPEPIERYRALLQLLSKEVLTLQVQDITVLISLLRDSQKKIRFAAGNVLSKYSRHLGILEESVVFIMLQNTIHAFHGIQNSEDLSKFSTNLVLETRIQALYNLKRFMNTIDCNINAVKYLNFIFSTILDSACSDVLKLAVLKIINEIQKTPRNIKRVLTLFRGRILSLKVEKVLEKEIERFKSIWDYYAFLKTSMNTNFVSSVSSSRKSILALGRRKIQIEESKVRINREIRLFGQAISIESHYLQDLDLSTLQSKEYLNQDIEKGVLKFGTDKSLNFSRFPFQETVYIRNMSIDKEHDFSLQVFPSEFFTLSPASGTLKSGESLGITVFFSPNPYASHILQMIHGFIRIRSMGHVLDRLL